MRASTVFAAFSLLLAPLHLASAQDWVASDTACLWYRTRGQWLHLQTFATQPLAQYVPDRHFKSASPYANYFAALSVDKLAYKGKFFEITPRNGLKITDLRTEKEFTPENPDADSERFGQHFLLPTPDGVLYVKHLSNEAGFRLYLYNTEGKALWSRELAHTERVKSQHLEYFRGYMQYLAHTERDIVFASYEPTRAETHTLDISTGEWKTLPFSAQGIVRAWSEEAQSVRAAAYIQFLPQNKSLRIAEQNADWQTTIAENWSENACFEGLRLPSGLTVVVAYERQRSGCTLYCLRDGKLQWSTNIDPIANIDPASHYNKVWLSHRLGNIIVEGQEPSRRYTHVYNASTGERLSVLRD